MALRKYTYDTTQSVTINANTIESFCLYHNLQQNCKEKNEVRNLVLTVFCIRTTGACFVFQFLEKNSPIWAEAQLYDL